MIDKSKEVVIVNAIRTPIGTYKGSLKNMKSHALGSIVIKEVLSRSKFDKDEIDEVIMGQVLTTDAGAGTAAHRSADNAPCVTISLDLKFIGASKVGDEIIGNVRILKKTKTLIFLFCELKCHEKIITSASGVWKILKVKPSSLGPGG